MQFNWWETAAFVGSVAALGALGFHLHSRKITKQVSAVLCTREQLTPDQFGECYFGEIPRRAALAKDVREMLASKLPYSLGGLTADDKIQETLRLDAFDSLASAELVMELEDRFRIELRNDEAFQKDMTIRDLVEYLDDRIKNRRCRDSG